MPRYQINVNHPTSPATTLSGAVTAAQTTLPLSDAGNFFTAGVPHPITVYATVDAVQHVEYPLVVGKSGNTLTVVRAWEEPARFPAYAFPSGASVEIGVTGGYLSYLATRRHEPVTCVVPRGVEFLTTQPYGDTVISATDWGIYDLIVVQGGPAPDHLYTATGDAITVEA